LNECRTLELTTSLAQAEPIASTSTSTPTSTTTSRSASPLVAPAAAEIQYLTIIDEHSLVTYYLSQFGALCKHFQFPEMVQASAMTYLKRFYLRNTCMDYHPKSVMSIPPLHPFTPY
jgi:cyclin H